MRFWTREVAGWLLVALGLYVFFMCISVMLSVGERPSFFETGPLTVIGIFLFRGGIHLLKVAMAARVCLHVQRENQRQSKKERLSEG